MVIFHSYVNVYQRVYIYIIYIHISRVALEIISKVEILPHSVVICQASFQVSPNPKSGARPGSFLPSQMELTLEKTELTMKNCPVYDSLCGYDETTEIQRGPQYQH